MSDPEVQGGLRKNRKELQAKIQALKKSASQGDKKRKKEVLEEIAKYAEQLKALELEDTKEPVEPEVVDSEAPQRVSKAQKRRDKKANEERDRQAEILAQELLNLHGPRQQESDSIKELLKSRNLVLHQIPSDGDCLYNAVRHQLELSRKPSMSVADLRSMTADYIAANKDDLIPFMTNASGDCLNESEFTKYVDAVRNTRAWGGQIEIQALSNSLRCPIEVLQANGSIVQGADQHKGKPPLVLTYHRHMYSLGEHYNSARTPPTSGSCEE